MESARSLDEVTGEIVDAAFKLHAALGPGLLESVYETILCRDLQRRGFQVERTLKEGLQRIVNGLPNSASPRLRVNQSPDPPGSELKARFGDD